MTLNAGFPPFFSERPTFAFYDPIQTYLIIAVSSAFITTLIFLPGFRGVDSLYFIIRWTLSLFVGVSIFVCINKFGWQTSVISTYLPSHGHGNALVRYEIGLYVGLSSVTITLKDLEADDFKFDYSEQFFYRQIDTDLTNALLRGLPTPILNIAEYFSFNGVTTKWHLGRKYWISGYYTTYMLWAALAIWVIGNFLLSTFIEYGALNQILSGLLLFGANITFTNVNSYCCPLEIHLGHREPGVLKPVYGWSFWLCLAVGTISIASGTVLLFSIYSCSDKVYQLFNLEKKRNSSFIGKKEIPESTTVSKIQDIGIYEKADEPSSSNRGIFKKITSILKTRVTSPHNQPSTKKYNNGEYNESSKYVEKYGSQV